MPPEELGYEEAGALASALASAFDRCCGSLQAGHRAAQDAQPNALLDLQRDLVVLDSGDLPDEPTGGDHLVALLQLAEHLLVQLGLLRLRPDDQQVEDPEDQRARGTNSISCRSPGRCRSEGAGRR